VWGITTQEARKPTMHTTEIKPTMHTTEIQWDRVHGEADDMMMTQTMMAI